MNHPLIARLLSASDRRAARQTLWMGAITTVRILSGLAQVSISARILGPEGYGVLAVIFAVTWLIYGLLEIPGGEAITTFVTRAVAEERPKEASRVVRFTLAVSLGLSLIAYALIAALAFTASDLLGIDQAYLDAAILYGVVGIPLSTHTETIAVLRLSDRLPLGLAVTIASSLTRIVLLSAAWLAEGGLLAVALAYVAGAAVNGTGMLVAATVSAPRAGMTDFLRSVSIRVPPDVIRFQIGSFGKSAIWILAHHMDSILLAQFTGAAEVGLYRGARQIINTTTYSFQLLMDGVQAEYSRQWYSRQGKALRRTSLRFTLVSFTLAAAGFGLLAVFHQPITRLILGAEFAGTAPSLLVMIPGAFVSTSVSVLTVLPAAVGRIRPSLAAAAAGLVASVAVIVGLAPLYGAEGAAWAYTTYFIVFVLVLMPFVISTLRQSRRLRQEHKESARVIMR